MIEAVTLDFGNTLVPVDAAGLRGVVVITASSMAGRLGPFEVDAVLAAWGEERERQFREEVPQFREVDLAQRVVRILARLRGTPPPAPDVPWDDAAAAGRSTPEEVEWAVEIYSRAFIEALPPDPAATDVLRTLAGRYRLGILSNWPLAATIDRYVEAHGWSGMLDTVVVSQRVGTIKPHPAIFAAARASLGDLPAAAICHVGDDWAADVVGAKRAGWRAGYLTTRPDDSPLPGSERDQEVEADFEIHALHELPAALAALGRQGASGSPGVAGSPRASRSPAASGSPGASASPRPPSA